MSRDCCSWDGVTCNEMTGHVIELNLSKSCLVGTIDSNSSLFQLSHLHRLDLSVNFFSNSHISPEFGRFSSLTHLDLSLSYFSGQIPSEISHLTRIEYLSLSDNSLNGTIPSGLFSLPSLGILDLGYNQFSGQLDDFKSNSLRLIGLSNNQLQGHLPNSIQNLVNLTYLDLSFNNFSGHVDVSFFSDLKHLNVLDLSNNQLQGHFPNSIQNLVNLTYLDLSNNQLQGHFPNSIQNLVNLTRLDLSFNNFSGHVDVSFFSDLKQLSYLGLSYNSISLTNENKVNFTLPESINYIKLAACEVKELEFLRSVKQLEDLDLSNNKIQGRIPDWAWSNWMFSLQSLNLSHNMLEIVDSIPLQYVETIDLRSNFLQGSLPIPPDFTRYFFISQNNLSEEIPSSICNLTFPVMLDLSRNNLKGEIPQCLGNFSGLQVLDMHHNSLSGTLPTTFSIGSTLKSFNFHGNKLEGKIPQSLTNCKLLEVLDVGDNNLNDTFPVWLGTLPELRVLSLRSNKLHGSIRILMTENMFPKLRILDLSYNAFTGNLPTSLFQHLKAMRIVDQKMNSPSDDRGRYYQDSVAVVTKGIEREIVRILFLYTTIDLSNNKFEGYIPNIMGDLIALCMLNLSHNGLQGPIPPSLGSLSSVESLDLSSNHLIGEIPAQLASLTYLAVLNLSHNHLYGCIPHVNQFLTFEKNSYEGNDGLHGFPLSKGCGSDRVSDTNYSASGLDNQESDSEFLNDFWKAALMGYGSGLCIGLSIVYFMISTGNPKWLARIIVELEHRINMRRKKKQRRLRNYKRRNNPL